MSHTLSRVVGARLVFIEFNSDFRGRVKITSRKIQDFGPDFGADDRTCDVDGPSFLRGNPGVLDITRSQGGAFSADDIATAMLLALEYDFRARIDALFEEIK